MRDELNALREEVARLRERVAVLEARPPLPVEHMRIGPTIYPSIQPFTVPPGSPYQVGDAPGWWLQGPTAAGTLGPLTN